MKKKRKKKVSLPRRKWQINPVTRVRGSARTYTRKIKHKTTDTELDEQE